MNKRQRTISESDAARLFPHSEYLRSRWLAAIAWLREQSTTGWQMDQFQGRLPEPKR